MASNRRTNRRRNANRNSLAQWAGVIALAVVSLPCAAGLGFLLAASYRLIGS